MEVNPQIGIDSEEPPESAAFNPETGEINWDCPCLGGMAYGPCGEEFRAAFSCFVYSEEEPKGIECIEKFKYVISRFTSALIASILTSSTGVCKIASVNTLTCTAPSWKTTSPRLMPLLLSPPPKVTLLHLPLCRLSFPRPIA